MTLLKGVVMTKKKEHLDNQICWCGDDHTWLDDEPQK